MAGISSKALKFAYPGNKKGYNGNELQSKEFSDGSGLELYDFIARTYDQQIGRFVQIDPEFENFDQESLSPYHFAKNDPIRFNDPTGRCPACVVPAIPWIIEGVATLVEAAIVVLASNELGKEISKAINDPMLAPVSDGGGIIVGSPLGVPTGTTFRKLNTNQNDPSDSKSISEKSTKENGSRTEPNLPDKKIVDKDGVVVEHYTRSGDHGPPHMHVKGEGSSTKIGQNGKPIKGASELSSKQSQVVESSKKEIRKAGKQIMKWFDYNNR